MNTMEVLTLLLVIFAALTYIGMHCKAHNIPAVAIVGSMGKGAEDIFDYGIESMITTINGVMTLPEALENAEELYLCAARRMFRMLRAGSRLA